MTRQLDIWWGDGVPKEKAKGSGFLSRGDQAKLHRDLGWASWKDSRREVSGLPWFIPGLGGARASSIQVIAPVFLNFCIPGVPCKTFVILLTPERLATRPHPEWQAWKVEAGWKELWVLGSNPGPVTSCRTVTSAPHLCEPHSGLSPSSPVSWGVGGASRSSCLSGDWFRLQSFVM